MRVVIYGSRRRELRSVAASRRWWTVGLCLLARCLERDEEHGESRNPGTESKSSVKAVDRGSLCGE